MQQRIDTPLLAPIITMRAKEASGSANRERESSSNSKSQEIVWRGDDQENDHINVPMDLVEIPVHHCKDRPPLADIYRKANLPGNKEKGKRCRKWKRVESKKEVTRGIVDTSKFHTGAGRIKRS